MKSVLLKLSDTLLDESDRLAVVQKLSRAEYIRRAIEQMNRHSAAETRRLRMQEASRKVRGESMKVNAEFGRIEDDVDA